MTVQPGDMIMVRGTSWLDRAIERITKSKYSHVCIYIGGGQVIEAQGGRTVGYQRLSFYEGLYDVYRTEKPLTDDQLRAITAYLVSEIGKKYDYLEIVKLFFRYALRLKFPYHETKRLICETLARDAYLIAGVDVPMADLSPGDLAACSAFGKIA